MWSDNLAATRSVNAVAGLADIRGRPVIDRGRVFAVSHSGRMAAIDLRTGDRVWEQQIGSSHGPWVAGDYVFVLANDNEVVCLTRNEGKVRWVRQLPRFRGREEARTRSIWAGPVLGGNRLIVLSSTGEAMSLSPYTGEPLGRQSDVGRRLSRAGHRRQHPLRADRRRQICPPTADLAGGSFAPMALPSRSSGGPMSASRPCSTGWSAGGWRWSTTCRA